MTRLSPIALALVLAAMVFPAVAEASTGDGSSLENPGAERLGVDGAVIAAQADEFDAGGFLDDPELAMAASFDPVGFLADPELVLAQDPNAPIMMSEADLDGQRGGFMTPLGLDIGFGAVVKTTVNGALALQTVLTWAPGQIPTKSVEYGPDALDLSTAAGLGAASLGGITLPSVPANWEGAVVPSAAGGATAVLQQIGGGGGVTNLLVNTANDRNIRQDTNVTLNVPDLNALTQQALGAAISSRIGDSLGRAITAASLK